MVITTVRADAVQGQVDAPAGRRRWLVLGYRGTRQARDALRGVAGSAWDLGGLVTPSTPDGPCLSPLLVWDGEAHAPVLWRCNSHRSARCGSCAASYRRRVRRVAGTGCLTRAAAGGHLGLLTLSAPGRDGHRRWVVGGRASESCGCESSAPHGIGAWNRLAGTAWNRLRTALSRQYPGCKFFRAVEVQTRGALHLHVIFWSPTPVAAQQVQPLALAAGFGCVLDWSPAAGGDVLRFAGYVSKYVTKSTDDRGTLPWDRLDPDTGELVAGRPTFRTWSQSKGFGCTMREHEAAVRAQRAAWAVRLRQLDALVPDVDQPAGQLCLSLDPAPDG